MGKRIGNKITAMNVHKAKRVPSIANPPPENKNTINTAKQNITIPAISRPNTVAPRMITPPKSGNATCHAPIKARMMNKVSRRWRHIEKSPKLNNINTELIHLIKTQLSITSHNFKILLNYTKKT